MANTRTGNTICVDTTGYTLADTVTIKAVKYIGVASGLAVITAGTAGTGAPIYTEGGTANTSLDAIGARTDGFHVALTNACKLFIYLE